MNFKYTHISNGEYKASEITAKSKKEAQNTLLEKGIVPLSLTTDLNFTLGSKQMPRPKVITMCTILSNSVDTGLPLTKIFEIIKEQATKSEKKMYTDIINNIQTGNSLAHSLKETGVFADDLIALIEVGEENGELKESLDSIILYYERTVEIQATIKQASAYPIILIALSIVMIIFFVLFIIPQITVMFEDQTLPAYTEAYLGVLDYLTHNIHKVLIVVGGLVIAYKASPPNVKVDEVIYTFIYRYSPIGKLLQLLFETRLIQILYIYISTGVSPLKAFSVMQGVFSNSHIKTMLGEVRVEISKGVSLSVALEKSNLLSKLTMVQISTADESGKLDNVLLSLNRTLNKELNNTIKSATSKIEPLFTVIIGVVIGSLILALMLPILNMSSSININE